METKVSSEQASKCITRIGWSGFARVGSIGFFFGAFGFSRSEES